MTDEQFAQIIKVLRNIEQNTSSIASDVSSIYTNVNTVNDLDTIHTQLNQLIGLMADN